MLKWVLAAIAAIISIALVCAMVGLTLPADHVASRQARFQQRPQALFALLAGPPNWRPEVARYEELPMKDGRPQWKENGVVFELVENAPPLRRSVRIADETLSYGGTWTYDIIPTEGGSLLRITEQGDVRNPLFRFVSKYVIGHTRSIENFLTDLGKKFNQPVVIEGEKAKPAWDKVPSAKPA